MHLIAFENDTVELLQAADRLAQYLLKTLEDNPTCKEPHKRAIMLSFMTSQMLQATYQGNESPGEITAETIQLLENFSKSKSDA